MAAIPLNARVRVKANHWRRPNSLGTITQIMENGRYEITFDDSYPGGGVEGNKLYLEYGVDFVLEEKA